MVLPAKAFNRREETGGSTEDGREEDRKSAAKDPGTCGFTGERETAFRKFASLAAEKGGDPAQEKHKLAKILGTFCHHWGKSE